MFFFRIENAILTCVPAHAAFYRPRASEKPKAPARGISPLSNAIWPASAATGIGSPRPRANGLKPSGVVSCAPALLCRCASFPECLLEDPGVG